MYINHLVHIIYHKPFLNPALLQKTWASLRESPLLMQTSPLKPSDVSTVMNPCHGLPPSLERSTL